MPVTDYQAPEPDSEAPLEDAKSSAAPDAEQQAAIDAAAAGSLTPGRGKTDPLAGLPDGAEAQLDAFSRPSPGGIRVFRKDGKTFVHCVVRKRDLRYKPEELVRQHVIQDLKDQLGYALEQIRVEVPVVMGSGVHDKPADIIVYTDATKTTQRLIVEVKKPRRKDGTDQLKSYMNATGAQFGWWTNGSDQEVLLRTGPNDFSNRLTRPPALGETLDDLDAPLRKKDLKPVADLYDLLKQCEDQILSHQNVNTFDELFKVIYAKLYDERMNLGTLSDVPEFRIGITEAPSAAAGRVRDLYKKATNKWKGVFKDDIELTDDNLAFVVAALQEYEFIGDRSGDVLGVAFEAMINEETKGEKGQYFTPRHVIEMCVRMLNPGLEEKVLDPACGSSGFLIHAMKHVNAYIAARWADPDQAAEHRKDYAQEMLVGLDNDARLVRIAKAYMIIENDGRSNIHLTDSLDRRAWTSDVKEKLEDTRVILTNPPFAGAIKVPAILSQYDLAYKNDPSKPKLAKSVVRAILFLERCINELQPGGRMAIVLPQGLMNNINDAYVRDFIDQHARILAIVGLHENTFRPFTSAKTSVVFLEKWQSEEERLEEYPLFMDVSRRPGKTSTGVPVWDADGKLDTDVLEIADAFREWARSEGFAWAG